MKKAEDRAFEATSNATELRNELADKEVALQAALRKLERARQAQAQQQPGGGAAAAAAAGSMGGAAGGGAAGGAGGAGGEGEDEAAMAIAELQGQVAQLQELLEQRTVEKDQQVEVVAQLQRCVWGAGGWVVGWGGGGVAGSGAWSEYSMECSSASVARPCFGSTPKRHALTTHALTLQSISHLSLTL